MNAIACESPKRSVGKRSRPSPSVPRSLPSEPEIEPERFSALSASTGTIEASGAAEELRESLGACMVRFGVASRPYRRRMGSPKREEKARRSVDEWVRASEDLARDLAGPHPAPEERLLAESVSIAWLEQRIAELMGAAADHPFWLKKSANAHRKVTSGLKMLAVVRRLALPILLARVSTPDAIEGE